MSNHIKYIAKKMLIRLLRISIYILGLACILILLSPALIKISAVQKKVISYISLKSKGDIKIEHIGISVFPYPHMVARNTLFVIPDKINAQITKTIIYPQLLPLLWGHFAPDEVVLENPVIDAKLPKSTGASSDISGESNILKDIQSEFPLIFCQFKNGTLNITDVAHNTGFGFQNIDATFDFGSMVGTVMVKLDCTSSLWKQLHLKSNIDISTFQSDLYIDLNNFAPQALIEYLYPQASIKISDADFNFKGIAHTNGMHDIKADFYGSLPFLEFTSPRHITITGGNFDGALNIDKNTTLLEFSHCEFNYPQLNLETHLTIDKQNKKNIFTVKADDLDVESVRTVALSLFDKSKTVSDIFDVIRKGKVPWITIQFEGKQLNDLFDSHNMFISGRMEQGQIVVPHPKLVIDQAAGEVVYAQGVLKGTGIKGNLGKTIGKRIDIQVDLAHSHTPFFLEAELTADLSELPQRLKYLIDNKTFGAQMDEIESISGTASGKLTIRQEPDGYKTRVDISKFDLEGQYLPIPYPFRIKGDGFIYSSDQIHLVDLSGAIGNITFDHLNAGIDWQDKVLLNLSIDRSDIPVDDLFDWVTCYDSIRSWLGQYSASNGIIQTDQLTLDGDINDPDHLKFSVSGKLQDLDICTPIREDLGIAHALFSANQNDLTLYKADTRFLGATAQMTCHFKNYISDLSEVDADFSGTVGDDFVKWLYNYIELPVRYQIRAPFKVSSAHLAWENCASTDFDASFSTANNTQLFLNARIYDDGYIIYPLKIKDDQTDVTIKAGNFYDHFHVGLDGHIKNSTLDRIMVDNPFVFTQLAGNIDIIGSPDNLTDMIVNGQLEGENIQPPGFDPPVVVDKINLQGNDRKVHIANGQISAMKSKWDIKGDAQFNPKTILLDMDAHTQQVTLPWGEKSENKNNASISDTRFLDWPIRGVVRFAADQFSVDHYAFAPFSSQIRFGDNRVDVDVDQADICGISTPGQFGFAKDDVNTRMTISGKNQNLSPFLKCFLDKEGLMNGNFDLFGQISGQGPYENWIDNLEGSLSFSAKDGRIYRFGLLAKIFAFLNVAELFKGKFPNLLKEGFAYNSFTAKGQIKDGKLHLTEAVIDSASMRIVCQGQIDLKAQTLDLTVLVAPFKTVDLIIKHTPVLKKILDQGLVSIPLKANGDLRDPKLSALTPTSVSNGVINIMKRTLEVPIQIIHPNFNGLSNNDEQSSPTDQSGTVKP